jgi:hypothetical protein
MTVTKLELGCGQHKRPGFFGIDIQPAPGVDLVMDFELQRLPFPDGSIEHIYSSHAFEHLEAPGSPMEVLREIVRVARHGATVEIWTPYAKSNNAMLFGHRTFFTEMHWEHICFDYDDYYLGSAPGRFVWERTQYLLYPGILDDLNRLQLPLWFAIKHMFNIAVEFGVFLRVDKTARKAERPQYPKPEYCYRRGELIEVPFDPMAQRTPPPEAELPLRYRMMDTLNASLKSGAPGLHQVLKKTLGRWGG